MKRTGLQPISKSKRAERRQWETVRQFVIERDETCRAAVVMPDIQCWGPDAVHHIRRRSQGGTNDPSNLVLLCASHHQGVHEQVARAVALGLLQHREAS